MKKVVIIKVGKNPLFVGTIKDFDSVEFMKVQKQCEIYQNELKDRERELNQTIANMKYAIESLEREIKILKGEE